MAFTAIFCFITLGVMAQNPYFIADQSTKVFDTPGDSLVRAWSGGFRSPMFSNIDANRDGVQDIFVFDRFDRSVRVFLRENGDYYYAPDYEYYFPAVTNWVLLEDFNCDGKKDLFASSSGGIQVWENTSAGGVLSFSQVTNYLVGTNGPVVVLSGDVPSITDVDFDGDLDILAFEMSSQYVAYYKNNSSGCGLDFTLETQCWGDFSEGGLSSEITLNDSCGGNKPAPAPQPQDQKNVMHQGSTVLAFDGDGDDDMELIIGDISSNHMKYLINEGTTNEAHIGSVEDTYPLEDSIDIYIFPMAFLMDADNDGDRDLIATTAEISLSGGQNIEQIWMYENTSTNTIPNFEFRQQDFLSDEALEVGAGAAPHFYDFDHDGDEDLLIGNFSRKLDPFDVKAGLRLYENVGTAGETKLELRDADFASLSDTLLFGRTPCTGDLDDDGDIDLLVGDSDGKLTYYENLSAPGTYPTFASPVYFYQGLDIGFGAAPFLFDWDRDGDLDLLIGEGNGNVNYLENIGTPSAPMFDQKTNRFGKVDVQNPLFTAGYGFSTPYIAQLDSNNNYDLVVGSYDGLVKIYMNIENYAINDSFPSITNTYYNSVSQTYADISMGQRTAPALSDLNGDGLQDMVVGLFRGGLHLLRNNSDTFLVPVDDIPLSVMQQINVYPNPTRDRITITSASGISGVQVLDVHGRIVQKRSWEGVRNEAQLDLSGLPRGMYHLHITSSETLPPVYRRIIRQ